MFKVIAININTMRVTCKVILSVLGLLHSLNQKQKDKEIHVHWYSQLPSNQYGLAIFIEENSVSTFIAQLELYSLQLQIETQQRVIEFSAQQNKSSVRSLSPTRVILHLTHHCLQSRFFSRNYPGIFMSLWSWKTIILWPDIVCVKRPRLEPWRL